MSVNEARRIGENVGIKYEGDSSSCLDIVGVDLMNEKLCWDEQSFVESTEHNIVLCPK